MGDARAPTIARVARLYVRQARALSYRELRASQEPPWASVVFGALGIAATLGAVGARAADLDVARRWIRAAKRGARTPYAFSRQGAEADDPDLSRDRTIGGSLYFGPDGARACADDSFRLPLRGLHHGRLHRRRRVMRQIRESCAAAGGETPSLRPM